MERIGITDARSSLYNLVAQTAKTNQPITITSKRGNAVLISEADWQAIQETLYLSNIKGMSESIEKGMQAPDDEFVDADTVEW